MHSYIQISQDTKSCPNKTVPGKFCIWASKYRAFYIFLTVNYIDLSFSVCGKRLKNPFYGN